MRVAVLRAHKGAARNYFEPFAFAGGHVHNGVEFIENPTEGQFDAIVAHQSMTPMSREWTLVCPPTRTLCALMEPPDLLTLPDQYTEQFYAVVGPDPKVSCQRLVMGAAGHHWFVELSPEQALREPITNKPRLISAVVSSKTNTRGHRIRLELMQHLKRHFGDQLEWFGRGVKEIGDVKLSALADFKYHIVLENGCWPHYWTEKLADSYVANAFPFYWGAPNAAEYFDATSFCPIDPADPVRTIAKIEAAIQSRLWETRQLQLSEARKRIVTQYHPYEIWRSILENLPQSEPRLVSIKPFDRCEFGLRQKLRFRLRSALETVGRR